MLRTVKMLESRNKIKVFVSSKCDDEKTGTKYADVRLGIKAKLENTGLAEVYVFEEEGSSTLSAVKHYSFALEDSDVCIFLIDNADGIPTGVQREIDIVQKRGIKALYYFCDENSGEKTEFEKSIRTADNAKSKTIHTFSELCDESSQALINDITRIYHYYCQGKLSAVDEADSSKTNNASLVTNVIDDVTFPKIIIDNIEDTTDYLYRIVLRNKQIPSNPKSEIDESARLFLEVALGGRSINEFNTSMFLERIKKHQTDTLYVAVELRWKAIQAYYDNKVEECLEKLNTALDYSKKNGLPKWFVNDLLIDIRNIHNIQCVITNKYSVSAAQDELDAMPEQLYYPIVDRVNETLQEKYNQGLYKESIKSPYTVTFGNNVRELVELIATSYVVSLYFGSLTHIRLLKEKLKMFFFYLTNVYDDWIFKYNLFKYALSEGNNKEIRELRNSFPEILNQLTTEEAIEIVKFCSIEPIEYERVIKRLRAFSFVGYYLDAESFKVHCNSVEADLKSWISDDNHIIEIGRPVFDCLSEVAYRLSQDKIATLCIRVMESGWSIYYQDMFKLIGKRISLNELSENNALNLISQIVSISTDEKTRSLLPVSVLTHLRRQNSQYSNSIDECVKEFYPGWYESYVLETTDDENVTNAFFQKTISQVRNSIQNKDSQGIHVIGNSRNIYNLYLLAKNSEVEINRELLLRVLDLMNEVLMNDQCSITNKMDAVLLLCYLRINNTSLAERCKEKMTEVYANEDQVLNVDFDMFSANVDLLALKCSIKTLSIFIDAHDYAGLVEMLALAKNDVATVLSISRFFVDLLVEGYKGKLGNDVEWLMLISSLEWMHINNIDVRSNATRILLALAYNDDNSEIINRTLVNIVKNENVYLKNLVLRRMRTAEGITDETIELITETCKHDPNYITREIANGTM